MYNADAQPLTPIINVYCHNKGWLFEDLKQLIASQGAVASEQPLPDADAWICIRDIEAYKSPDPLRTLVQCHHMQEIDSKPYGVISFTHRCQAENYHGLSPWFIQPIGSREDVKLGVMPETPTLGGFFRGGPSKGLKLWEEAVKIARKHMDFDVLLIGERLESIAYLGKYESRPAGVEDYKRITALLTTSESQNIPLSAFEALAAGRAVISTPRQWEGWYMGSIYTGCDAETLAEQMVDALRTPPLVPQIPWSRTAWAKRQVEEARKLCKK